MYEPKAKATEITYLSKGTIKIRDNYFSIEATETRSVPDIEGVDMKEEWKALCNEVDGLVDFQLEQIVKTYKV